MSAVCRSGVGRIKSNVRHKREVFTGTYVFELVTKCFLSNVSETTVFLWEEMNAFAAEKYQKFGAKAAAMRRIEAPVQGGMPGSCSAGSVAQTARRWLPPPGDLNSSNRNARPCCQGSQAATLHRKVILTC